MTNMTKARVFELIEAYGPEPAAWPQAEREAAGNLLQSHADIFAEAIAEARALDMALSGLAEPQPSPDLAARIIASAPIMPDAAVKAPGLLSRLKSKFMIGGSILPSASALASSAVGLIIGYGAIGTTQVAETDYANEAVYAAFDEGYDFEVGEFGG